MGDTEADGQGVAGAGALEGAEVGEERRGHGSARLYRMQLRGNATLPTTARERARPRATRALSVARDSRRV
jgi:hypothetical protein